MNKQDNKQLSKEQDEKIPVIEYCTLMFGEETKDNERDWQIASAAFLAGEYSNKKTTKQKCILFSEWKDRYMNNPPIGELASDEKLYDLYIQDRDEK
jgi:hypothetical protein